MFRTVFASIARKKMPDKCVVFRCNNRPNKGKGISLHPTPFDGTDDTEKRKKEKEVGRLKRARKRTRWEHEIFGGVLETLPG